jgi:signal peptidase I
MWVLGILVGLSVVVMVGGFGVVIWSLRSFTIPSSSMEPALKPGDGIVTVDQFTDVRRGDIVIVNEPAIGGSPPIRTVRRVIAMGGDQVGCAGAGAPITVNGRRLDEPYLFPGDVPSEQPFNVVVPQETLWLMGDHRVLAADSRLKGSVPTRAVVARVVLKRSGLNFTTVGRSFPTALLIAESVAAARSPLLWRPLVVTGTGVKGVGGERLQGSARWALGLGLGACGLSVLW